jgi:hypothetical protein
MPVLLSTPVRHPPAELTALNLETSEDRAAPCGHRPAGSVASRSAPEASVAFDNWVQL